MAIIHLYHSSIVLFVLLYNAIHYHVIAQVTEYQFGDCVRSLDLKNAVAIDITNCNMKEFPSFFNEKSMPKLEQIFMNGNPVGTFPKSFRMRKLTILTMNNCELKDLDTISFPNLKTVLLEDNQLTTFPKTLFKSKKLRDVLMRGNPILLPQLFSIEEVKFLTKLSTLAILGRTDGEKVYDTIVECPVGTKAQTIKLKDGKMWGPQGHFCVKQA